MLDHSTLPVTPLRWSQFELVLSKCKLVHSFPSLLHYIRYGFPIGPMSPITTTLIQRNHFRTSDELEIVRSYFRDEVEVGRMVGPITISQAEEAIGPFRTSPVGLVPKAGSPGKFRIIRDLSYTGDAQSSVNDEIPSDRYTLCVGWDDFANLVRIFFDLARTMNMLHRCGDRSRVTRLQP